MILLLYRVLRRSCLEKLSFLDAYGTSGRVQGDTCKVWRLDLANWGLKYGYGM